MIGWNTKMQQQVSELFVQGDVRIYTHLLQSVNA